MAKKEDIRKDRLPNHIAVIMDGNGRWAKKRGNQRIFGHKNGVQAVKETVEGSAELGINYLTLYAFSRENWNRPKQEIDALMNLLVTTVDKELSTLQKNNIKLHIIGDLSELPDQVQEKIEYALESTQSNSGLNLILALNYSARWEILNAMKKYGEDIQKQNKPSDLDLDTVNRYLTTGNIPDPD